MVKKPCAARTLPWPLQCRQVDMPVPGLAPEPSQVLQVTSVGTSISTVRPRKASSSADFEIVAQVRAAQPALLALPAAAALAAHEVAENVLEDIGHRGGEFGPETVGGAAAAHAAILERGVAEAVIGGALLGVLQRVVGLVDFLELVLGVGIARIAVRMELHGELAVGALERRLVRALRHAQHIVEIAFGQQALPLNFNGATRRRALVATSKDGARRARRQSRPQHR